jgi:hypothetical protein
VRGAARKLRRHDEALAIPSQGTTGFLCLYERNAGTIAKGGPSQRVSRAPNASRHDLRTGLSVEHGQGSQANTRVARPFVRQSHTNNAGILLLGDSGLRTLYSSAMSRPEHRHHTVPIGSGRLMLFAAVGLFVLGNLLFRLAAGHTAEGDRFSHQPEFDVFVWIIAGEMAAAGATAIAIWPVTRKLIGATSRRALTQALVACSGVLVLLGPRALPSSTKLPMWLLFQRRIAATVWSVSSLRRRLSDYARTTTVILDAPGYGQLPSSGYRSRRRG